MVHDGDGCEWWFVMAVVGGKWRLVLAKNDGAS